MAQAGRAGKGTLCLGRTGILLPCPAAAASAPGLLRRRKGINRRFPRGRESSVFPALGTSSAAAFASSFHASACDRNNSGTIGFKKCMKRMQNGFSSIACCILNASWYLKGNTGIQKAARGILKGFLAVRNLFGLACMRALCHKPISLPDRAFDLVHMHGGKLVFEGLLGTGEILVQGGMDVSADRAPGVRFFMEMK